MNDKSIITFNNQFDPTTAMITSFDNDINRDEQCIGVTMNDNEGIVMTTTTNVNDSRENQRDREKGEREKREDGVKRISTSEERERERDRQRKKSIDLVTSFNSEQYNCPIVNTSMANLLPTSFNSNNNHQNISLSNNRSRRSSYTYNASSSNSYPTHSMTHHLQDYVPSYPSIPRHAASLSPSPYRKTHYLDASDEEIIDEEILQVTTLNHYPTLIERWGDDTKIIVRQQGELKIEDYVEFEEIEPTITEEIFYEIIYSGDQIQSTREIHHTHSTSRNFRKLRKRRTKRKRTASSLNATYHLSEQISSIIQTGDKISNHNNGLSGDNHLTDNTRGDRISHIDIIVNNRSIPSLKSDEQEKDAFERIIEQKKETNASHRSSRIATEESHVLYDNHQLISIAQSSINQSNEDQTNSLAAAAAQLHRVDRPTTINNRKENSNNEAVQFIESQPLNLRKTGARSVRREEELLWSSPDETNDRSLSTSIEQAMKCDFDEDLQSRIKSYSPDSFNEYEQTRSAKKWNDLIGNKSEITSIEKPEHSTARSSQSIGKSKRQKISTDQQSTMEFEKTKCTPEQISPDALTKLTRPIRPTQIMTQLPPTNILNQETEESFTDSVMKNDYGLSTSNRTTGTDDPMQNKIQCTPSEQRLPSNALVNIVSERITTSPPLHHSSNDYTPKPVNQQMEKPSIQLLTQTSNPTVIEATQFFESLKTVSTQIMRSGLSTEENIIQHAHYDKDSSGQKSIDEIATPCYSPTTMPASHSPSTEIKTAATFNEQENDVKSTTSLPSFAQKQSALIANPSMTKMRSQQDFDINENESILTDSTVETNDNESVNFSSDFLADIVRQINAAKLTIHHTSVKHLKQTVENVSNDSSIENIVMNSSTSRPQIDTDDNGLMKSNRFFSITELIPEIISEDRTSVNRSERLSSNTHTEITPDILTKPSIDDSQDTSTESETNKASSDTFIETTPLLSTSLAQSILYINEPASHSSDTNTPPSVSDSLPNQSKLESTSIGLELVNFATINASLKTTDNDLQQSTELDTINQPIAETTQITNHIVQLPTTRTTEHFTNTLQELEIIEKPSSSNIWDPQLTRTSDTDSEELTQYQDFPITTSEQILTDSSSIDQELLVEKAETPDFTKTYYELQEQRHIQAFSSHTETEQNQSNANNHVQSLNLESFTSISNLPSKEYRQVFGIPNEVINTVDNLTLYSGQPSQSNIVNSMQEVPLVENFKDHPAIVTSDVKGVFLSVSYSQQHDDKGENVIAESTLTPTELISTDQNASSPSSTPITHSEQKIGTPLQSSTSDEEDHHDVSNTIARVISDLGSFNGKNTGLESLVNVSHTSITSTQQSEHSDHPQLTFIHPVRQADDNAHEQNTSTQERVAQQQQSIPSHYPWYATHYKVSPTESQRLFSTDHSSTSPDTQQNTIEQKPSCQELQVMHDDYPWYSSHYAMVDAETKIAQLHNRLNLANKQPLSSTTLKSESETREQLTAQDHVLQDDDEFHVVQRRKRIPSSTTHEKMQPSLMISTKLVSSPDIDLEPVVLHGRRDVPITVPSIVPPTTNTITKKKRKQKKKKTEMILFDAPELTSSGDNKHALNTVQGEIVEEYPTTNSTLLDETLEMTISNKTNSNLSDSFQQPEHKETLEDHQAIVSTVRIGMPTTISHDELNFRYSLLHGRLETLIKLLVDLPSSSCTHPNETIAPKNKEGKILLSSMIQSNIILHQEKEISVHNTTSDIEKSSENFTENIQLAKEMKEEIDGTSTTGHQQVAKQTIEEQDSSKVIDGKRSTATSTIHKITYNVPATITDLFDTKHVSPQISAIIDLTNCTTDLIKTDGQALLSNATDKQVVGLKPSRDLPAETKSSHQQQSSSMASAETMKHCVPSALQSNPTAEPILALTEPTSNDRNASSASSTASTDAEQTPKTALQPSTSAEENCHAVVDAAVVRTVSSTKETISSLASSNKKTTVPEYPFGLSHNPTADIQQSEHSDHPQLTFIHPVRQADDNAHAQNTSTQERVSQQQLIPSHYPWYATHYKVSPTESQRLLSTDHSSISSDTQQNTIEQKPSCQELQVMHDDYPWYSSHYAIVDAEAKIAQLHNRLNHANKQPLSATTLKSESETREQLTTQDYTLQDQDDDEFHVVQRRKRIPSSTIHDKMQPPPMISAKLVSSPDIDLEPVVLHGCRDVSITVPSILPPTTNTITKKKRKQKKKKTEMILFDAPEPRSSDINSKKRSTVKSETAADEEERQENAEVTDTSLTNETLKDEVEQFHPISTKVPNKRNQETLFTSIVSNTVMMKQIADDNHKGTFLNESNVLWTPTTTYSEDIKINPQSIEQRSADEQTTLQSVSSSNTTTTKIINTKLIVPSYEKDEDNEDFQLVSRSRRIRPATRREKALPASATTPKSIHTSGSDLKTSAKVVNDSSTSEEKTNICEVHEKDTLSSSSNKWTDQTTTLQISSPSSSSVIEDPNLPLKTTLLSTIKALPFGEKTSTYAEEDKDSEEFQLVRHRKRVKTALTTEKAQASSLATIKHVRNISHDIDLRPVAIHGHHNLPLQSNPHIVPTTDIASNKIKQRRSKHQKKQTSLLSTPSSSSSTEMHIIRTNDADNTFETPTEMKHQSSFDSKLDLEQAGSITQSPKQIAQECYVSSENQLKPTDQQSSVNQNLSSTTFNVSDADIAKSTLTEDDDNDDDEFQIVRYPEHASLPTIFDRSSLKSISDQISAVASVKGDSVSSPNTPKTIISQTSDPKNESKTIEENTLLSSPTNDIDLIPISIEETAAENVNDHIQHMLEPEIVVENNSSSTSDDQPSVSTTYESIASQNSKSIQESDNTQNSLHSHRSVTLLTTADSELVTSHNEPLNRSQHLRATPSITHACITPTTFDPIQNKAAIALPTHIEDEQIQTIPNKKRTKRRKKKLHSKEKPTDESPSTSSNSTVVTRCTTHTNTNSNFRKFADGNQEWNWTPVPDSAAKNTTTTQSFSSPSTTSRILPIKEYKSPQITTTNNPIIHQVRKTVPSTVIASPVFSTFLPPSSTHPDGEQHSDEKTMNKLDLFLPEYIRQQLNTSQTTSSSSSTTIATHSNSTLLTTSSDGIPKKKPRVKMLPKDPDAKSLLTHEFDIVLSSEKPLDQRTISTDDENIHDDDDEFIIQSFHLDLSEKEPHNSSPPKTLDNILSRGFHLWLQESRALSQLDEKSSSKGLLNAMRSIVIQPAETDEDEDSWDTNDMIKSTLMIGVQSEKKIHLTSAYFINHPHSTSTPSWFTGESDYNRFQDDARKFDSDDEDDSIHRPSKKPNSHQGATQLFSAEKQPSSSNHDSDQLTSSIIDNAPQDSDRSSNKNNTHTIHFDDWAYFLNDQTEHDLSTSLECFYARILDDDTLISDAIPIQHEKQRYGDFLSSNNDRIISEPTTKVPTYKFKPSEYFRKHESISLQYDNADDDDEIFISHSNNGLSRRMIL